MIYTCSRCESKTKYNSICTDCMLAEFEGDDIPSARITGDKGRENPAEGAPYGEGLIGRITELEHDNALLRRALAYAQRQQLSLMDERTRYQVALIRIAEVDEGGLAEYTPQAMVAQARQALAQNERKPEDGK